MLIMACWCAGLAIGRGERASGLLEAVPTDGVVDLDPRAPARRCSMRSRSAPMDPARRARRQRRAAALGAGVPGCRRGADAGARVVGPRAARRGRRHPRPRGGTAASCGGRPGDRARADRAARRRRCARRRRARALRRGDRRRAAREPRAARVRRRDARLGDRRRGCSHLLLGGAGPLLLAHRLPGSCWCGRRAATRFDGGTWSLPAHCRRGARTRSAQAHEQAGWTVFLQELWGRPEWPEGRFYEGGEPSAGASARPSDGWFTVEAGVDGPDVAAAGQELDAVLMVGGAPVCRTTVPSTSGARITAGDLRAALTTAARTRALPRRRARGAAGPAPRSAGVASRAARARRCRPGVRARAIGRRAGRGRVGARRPGLERSDGDRPGRRVGRAAPGPPRRAGPPRVAARGGGRRADRRRPVRRASRRSVVPPGARPRACGLPARAAVAPGTVRVALRRDRRRSGGRRPGRRPPARRRPPFAARAPLPSRATTTATRSRRCSRAVPTPGAMTPPTRRASTTRRLHCSRATDRRGARGGLRRGPLHRPPGAAGRRALAPDISSLALERAAARCAGHENVSFERLDLAQDPAPGRSTRSSASEVLYFVGGLAGCAARLAGALAPGGLLVAAHANLVADEPAGPGFDWDVPFGWQAIGAALRRPRPEARARAANARNDRIHPWGEHRRARASPPPAATVVARGARRAPARGRLDLGLAWGAAPPPAQAIPLTPSGFPSSCTTASRPTVRALSALPRHPARLRRAAPLSEAPRASTVSRSRSGAAPPTVAPAPGPGGRDHVRRRLPRLPHRRVAAPQPARLRCHRLPRRRPDRRLQRVGPPLRRDSSR